MLVAFHEATTRPPGRMPSRSTDPGVTSAVSPPTVTRARLPCTVTRSTMPSRWFIAEESAGGVELEGDLPRGDEHRHGTIERRR